MSKPGATARVSEREREELGPDEATCDVLLLACSCSGFSQNSPEEEGELYIAIYIYSNRERRAPAPHVLPGELVRGAATEAQRPDVRVGPRARGRCVP